MRILITGASGFIGEHVTRQLAVEHEVFAVTRNASVLEGVDAIAADLAAPFDTSNWPAVDVVVHLAPRHGRTGIQLLPPGILRALFKPPAQGRLGPLRTAGHRQGRTGKNPYPAWPQLHFFRRPGGADVHH